MIGRQLTSDGWGQQNPHFSCRRPSRRPNLHFEAHSFLNILVFRIAYPWPWRWGSGSTCSGCQEQQDQQTCTQAESPDHSSHHRDSQGVKFIVCGVSNTALPLSRCRWSCPHPSNWVDWVARKSCRWRRCKHRSRPQKCHNTNILDASHEYALQWWEVPGIERALIYSMYLNDTDSTDYWIRSVRMSASSLIAHVNTITKLYTSVTYLLV